jgi:hypothetical protein
MRLGVQKVLITSSHPHEPNMAPPPFSHYERDGEADQAGSNSWSLLGIRSYGSAKPGIALRRPAQAAR